MCAHTNTHTHTYVTCSATHTHRHTHTSPALQLATSLVPSLCVWKGSSHSCSLSSVLILFLELVFFREIRLSYKNKTKQAGSQKPCCRKTSKWNLVPSHSPLGSNLAEIFLLEAEWAKIKTKMKRPERAAVKGSQTLHHTASRTLTTHRWSHRLLAGGSNYRCDSDPDPVAFSSRWNREPALWGQRPRGLMLLEVHMCAQKYMQKHCRDASPKDTK